MPSDIRNFFGGKPAAPASQEPKQAVSVEIDLLYVHCTYRLILYRFLLVLVQKAPAKKARRKVIEDSDEDEEEAYGIFTLLL